MFRVIIHLFAAAVLVLGASPGAAGQESAAPAGAETLKAQAPKVFLDGRSLDLDYVKTEITYVNYVRDRKEADVHVLVTEQDTGSGGREFTLAFIGLNGFSETKNTLTYASNKAQTEDEIRAGLTDVLKMGLVGYAARTPIQSRLGVVFRDRVQPTSVRDPWNFWVFSAGADGWLVGERSHRSGSVFLNLSANRVTPRSKLRLGITGSFETARYDYEGYRYTDTSDAAEFSGLYVKSLGEHWSVGAFLSVASSAYRNIRWSVNPAPAIEFDLFPYSESTRRQLRFLYRLNVIRTQYREETIYDRLRETRLSQSLEIALEVKEPWGTAEAWVSGSHFLHDLRMHRLRLGGEVSLRLAKGWSLNADARYERLRDQLGLPKGGLTLEEILLRRKEMATGYSYFLSLGLSYTFGSIYSNVVNPRFGAGPEAGWGPEWGGEGFQ